MTSYNWFISMADNMSKECLGAECVI